MKLSEKPIRRCGTMEAFQHQVELYPEIRMQQHEIEQMTNRMLRERGREYRVEVPKGPCTIPVVVHVVYNEPVQNIEVEQIYSQIDILNDDFRARNVDIATVPEPWKDLASDTNIEFELALFDPNGFPTDGIIRTPTSLKFFCANEAVKASTTGGSDPWPTDRYLNIWVCHLSDGLLGYAQFPGGPPETDGVVIQHTALGSVGTAAEPFNLGRTATHEVGHYLNLSHIFGDNRVPICNDSDLIDDTPNQLGPNYEKPTFPRISCNNGPHGDMFVNYMDYVDDAAMFMFTSGQAARMNAALAGPRRRLWSPDDVVS